MELITGTALHVITGRLQARVTGNYASSDRNDLTETSDGGPESLQNGPEITSNGTDVMPLPDMEGSGREIANRYRDSLYLSSSSAEETASSVKPKADYTIPPCFLSTRAYDASLPPGALPDRCPNCGSKDVAPLFWPDASLDLFSCFDDRCFAVFCWRD